MKGIVIGGIVLVLLAGALISSSGAEMLSGWIELEIADNINASKGSLLISEKGAELISSEELENAVAGIASEQAYDLTELKTTVVSVRQTFESPSCYCGIFLTRRKASRLDALEGYTYGMSPYFVRENGLGIIFYGDTEDMKVSVCGTREELADVTIKAGREAVVDFKLEDGRLAVYINETRIVWLTENETENITIDSKSYISYCASGFGNFGGTGPFIVKSINGEQFDKGAGTPVSTVPVSRDENSSCRNNTD